MLTRNAVQSQARQPWRASGHSGRRQRSRLSAFAGTNRVHSYSRLSFGHAGAKAALGGPDRSGYKCNGLSIAIEPCGYAGLEMHLLRSKAVELCSAPWPSPAVPSLWQAVGTVPLFIITQPTEQPPNRSFNRTRYGKAAWPPGAQVHHAPVGQAASPPRAG